MDEELEMELRAEIERLRAALRRYGLHTWDCRWNDTKGDQPCDCGFAELADQQLNERK